MEEQFCYSFMVSIQLVSPASGEFFVRGRKLFLCLKSFHSISFPSEWGDEINQDTLNEIRDSLISPFPFN